MPLAPLYTLNACWKNGICVGFAVARLARVAAWNCGVGRFTSVLANSTYRIPSSSKKKNSLSFLIGPPMEPAYWLLFAKPFGAPELLLNQSLAFIESPFQNQLPLPWNWLVPDLVVMVMLAPA